MTKILKKSLACLLAFVLCFTAIAGCLAVSAEAPAITVGSLDLYVERPSNPNSPHPEVCEGERIRLQFGMGDLVKGTTMGIKILMPDGLTTEDIDVAGWHSSPAGIKIVSKYLDPETRWFTMVVNVTSDGNWNFYVRFDATANIPKDAVYGVYAEIEAATTSATGDENIFTHKTNTRPMRVMTSHNVVTDDAVAATCEGTGLTEGSHCSRCEKVLVAQEEVKALGHNYGKPVDNGNGTHTATCANDANHTITADHEYVDGTCACGAKENTHQVTMELYAITSPNNLVHTIGFNTLEEALAVSYDYTMGYVAGYEDGYDAIIKLNQDVTLTSDAEVTSYTVLDLGDYVINTNNYALSITGSGSIKANYELNNFDDNILVAETIKNGVYTYKLTIQLTFDSKSLTLSDSIFMNFQTGYKNNSAYTPEYGLTYYKSTSPDNVINVTSDQFTSSTPKKFTVQTIGIPAKEMGVEFVSVYYAKVTVDGVDYYAYSNTNRYSIVQYAKNKMNSNEKTKNLLVAMLNYGAAAQKYYDFDTENLANSILSEEDKQLPANYQDYLIPAITAPTLEDYSSSTSKYVKNASLELLDAINIKYTLSGSNASKTYKLCVWTKAEYDALVGSVTDEAELAKLLVTENAGSVLDFDGASCLLTGIAAKQFANTYYTRMVEIDNATGTETYDWLWTYSPMQYCINKIKANAKETEIGKTMAVYSAMARVYFDGYVIDTY